MGHQSPQGSGVTNAEKEAEVQSCFVGMLALLDLAAAMPLMGESGRIVIPGYISERRLAITDQLRSIGVIVPDPISPETYALRVINKRAGG